MHRKYFIDELCSRLSAPSYLEIGTGNFDTFSYVRARRKHGVDPYMPVSQPTLQILLSMDSVTGGTEINLFRKTSDEFFQADAMRFAPFDVIFIDGMHLYEYVSRDVQNAFEVLAPTGVVLLHDVCPRSFESQLRSREPGKPWHGDVWKVVVEMYLYHPEREIMTWMDGTFEATRSDYPDHTTVLYRNKQGRVTHGIPYVERADIAHLSYDYYVQNRNAYLNLQTKENILSILQSMQDHTDGTCSP